MAYLRRAMAFVAIGAVLGVGVGYGCKQQLDIEAKVEAMIATAPHQYVVSVLRSGYRRALNDELLPEIRKSGLIGRLFMSSAVVNAAEHYTKRRRRDLYDKDLRIVPDLNGDGWLGDPRNGGIKLDPVPPVNGR
jgi:hypothetical protein